MRILKYAMAIAAIAMMAGNVGAQTNSAVPEPTFTNGVVLGKSVTQPTIWNKDNTAGEIKLEVFVTGKVVKTITETYDACDIVLVLDVSTSMADNMNSYTPKEGSYSYSNIDIGTSYYYKYEEDGKYHKVSGERSSSNKYYLRFSTTDSKNNYRYIMEDGTSVQNRSDATCVTANNVTIYSGVLYTRSTSKKIDALKTAVKSFIKAVGDEAVLHGAEHQIAIVPFANTSSINTGLTKVKGNVTTLQNKIDALTTSNYTRSDLGLEKAATALDGSENKKVVVMFTDGEPCSSSDWSYGFSTKVANQAIDKAKTLKNNDAIVYTIGVFDNETDNIKKYMNYVSSNYPTASSMSNAGTPIATPTYYQKAESAEELKDIFTSISEEASEGGSTTELGSTTIVKDVMSKYFTFPAGTDADNITVKVAKCIGYPEDKSAYADYTFGSEMTFADAHEADPTNFKEPDPDIDVDIDNKTLVVTNYSISEHWCGDHEGLGKQTGVGGYKLIIYLPIVFDNVQEPRNFDWTNVPTNDVSSGVYLANGEVAGKFPVPRVDLSNVTQPIELLSFHAECIDNAIQFNWSTATETNNEYFTLECSEDAVNYKEIARIQGAGTSAYRQDYSFMADNTSNRTMYYRLRQTDIDGTTEVFEPIAVQCNTAGAASVNMYPVPAKDYVTLQSNEEIASVQLYNVYGALVNTMEVNANNTTIPVASLSAGIYTVNITMANGEHITKKLINH